MKIIKLTDINKTKIEELINGPLREYKLDLDLEVENKTSKLEFRLVLAENIQEWVLKGNDYANYTATELTAILDLINDLNKKSKKQKGGKDETRS